MITTELSLIDRLHAADGKAEIIDGAIVFLPMSGRKPTRAAEAVFVSPLLHVRRVKMGEACPDGNDYLVDLPHRQSFRPDASYFIGRDLGMKFIEGAPDFAVDAEQPATVYRCDELADAEPAVPGWTMSVDDLFAGA